jgi:hypothetical protein
MEHVIHAGTNTMHVESALSKVGIDSNLQQITYPSRAAIHGEKGNLVRNLSLIRSGSRREARVTGTHACKDKDAV